MTTGNRAVLPRVSVVVATRDRTDLMPGALRVVHAPDYTGLDQVLVVFDQSEPAPMPWEDAGQRTSTTLYNDRTPVLAGSRNSDMALAAAHLVAICDDDGASGGGMVSTRHILRMQIVRGRGV